jgi:hypothetical protein
MALFGTHVVVVAINQPRTNQGAIPIQKKKKHERDLLIKRNMPSSRILARSPRDRVQFRIQARRRREMVSPVAVPGRHGVVESICLWAAVRRLQGVEVRGLD